MRLPRPFLCRAVSSRSNTSTRRRRRRAEPRSRGARKSRRRPQCPPACEGATGHRERRNDSMLAIGRTWISASTSQRSFLWPDVLAARRQKRPHTAGALRIAAYRFIASRVVQPEVEHHRFGYGPDRADEVVVSRDQIEHANDLYRA